MKQLAPPLVDSCYEAGAIRRKLGGKVNPMTATSAYDRPLAIEVFDGEVVLRSPEGPFGVSLTAAAAAKTAEDLAVAARQALADQESQTGGLRD